MKRVNLSSWPQYSESEIGVVADVLRSGKVNYWTGDEGRLFEKEFSNFVDCKFGVALANGTVALSSSLIAIGIKAGDEVIVTPRTFLASVTCILALGAIPVFVDVDLDSQNITAETISPAINNSTKAIICVHLAGLPCDMDPIMDLASSHSLYVIEDCAQAHGARYKGRHVGSIGHIAAWSFCQDKIMTTGGEGGMVTTNDAELWEKVWSYKDHGKSYDAVYCREHEAGFRWLHESIGTNWRLTEMQAALGRYQLGQLDEWNAQRARNALKLKEYFLNIEFIRVPSVVYSHVHAWYKFYCFVEEDKLPNGVTRDVLIAIINAAGIPCMQGSCSEVYKEKAFSDVNYKLIGELTKAKKLFDTSLMFFIHPTIVDEEMHGVISKIHSTFERSGFVDV